MTKLRAFWRIARLGALGLAVAIVIGVVAQPAEARWRCPVRSAVSGEV